MMGQKREYIHVGGFAALRETNLKCNTQTE